MIKPTETPTLKAFELALNEHTPSDKHRARAAVTEALSAIEKHVARRVPMSHILASFVKHYAINIGLPRFRLLIRQAQAARDSATAGS